MNEFEKLEEELKELRPLPTSEEFTGRLEKALGDAGKVAMRCHRMKMRRIKNGRVPHRAPASLLSLSRLAVFAGLTGRAWRQPGQFFLPFQFPGSRQSPSIRCS